MIDDVDDILDVEDKTDGTEYRALRHTAVDWEVCRCFARVNKLLPTIAEVRTKQVQGFTLHAETTVKDRQECLVVYSVECRTEIKKNEH